MSFNDIDMGDQTSFAPLTPGETDVIKNLKILKGIENINLPQFYSNSFFRKIVKGQIEEDAIGAGYQASSVRKIRGTDLAVKKITPCRGDQRDRNMRTYCEHIKEEDSIRKSSYGNKDLLELPTFLMESIIGGYMGNLNDLGYTHHLSPVYGMWLDMDELAAYMVIPLLKGRIEEKIETVEDLVYFLFQVSQGLSIAQEVYDFTHYDLHGGNIMYEEENDNIYHQYHIPDENGELHTYYVKSRGFSSKIIDYGLSRMEANSTVIVPRLDIINSKGIYHRNYDILSIIGWLFVDARLEWDDQIDDWVPTNPLYSKMEEFRSFVGKEHIRIINIYSSILSAVFNDENIEHPQQYDFGLILQSQKYFEEFFNRIYNVAVINGIKQKVYRPLQNLTFVNSAHHITRKLAELMIRMGIATKERPEEKYIIETNRLIEYRYKDPLKIRTIFIKDKTPNPNIYYVCEGLTVQSYFSEIIYPVPIENKNITPSRLQIEECPSNKQYIHTVYIDGKKSWNAGYRLRSECCKLDVISHVSDRFGLATNAGFFDIFDTMKPIGKARFQRKDKPEFRSDLPIPDAYMMYYSYICIRRQDPWEGGNGNEIIIRKNDDTMNFDDIDDYFLCGPVLIENGKNITSAYIKHLLNYEEVPEGYKQYTRFGISKFSCAPNVDGGRKDMTTKIYVPNHITTYDVACRKVINPNTIPYISCDTIKPGELSHANNSNPRTMLVIFNEEIRTKYNRDFAIVYFEGRDERGMGVTIEQMAYYASTMEGVENAINLDGGRSSGIAWRSENNPDVVFIANPTHNQYYPVGNILSILKE